ncbi:hypothetical protein FisN_10Lh180 [Fistulifera solaris]|uniref:Uncharacterized protein n=1 Tax=Fistulifera solaris TaxID=1519565 RepID=A0A1Z5JTW7_FISSO|nr:hypothetical protein FisN_10Lh180 [Fistulifera solaris]|eukprot:GAX17316.1 hypothetical protein FisN_10Lh180 [Fistulifera solaris]
MKIASAYLIASLYILPSARAAVRSRSLVRGVTAQSEYRLLQQEAETPEPEEPDDSGDEPESKGGKKESPIAPKKRDCKLRQETETNEVSFKCKAKSDDTNAKVKDEIDYVVGTSEKGVMVKIKYEQKIKVEDEEKEHEHEEGEEHDHEHEDQEEPSPEEESAEPPADEESPEPPADEETPEPPADKESPEPPADEETPEPPADEETQETPVDDEGAQLPETPPPTEAADDSPEGAEGQRALQAEQETKTQFEVIYDSIIEYTKGENSTTGEAYDWENDVVLQTISLNTWNVISDVASDNETSSFSLTSPDGNITFTFTINQAPKGESASANKMKIDFELKDFPWTSNDSFVALLSTVETERKVDVKYRKGMESEAARMEAEDVFIAFDDVADTTSFTPFGEYSWAETAEATTKGASTNQTTDATDATTAATNETEIMSSRSVNTTSQTIKVVATSPLVERAERRAQEGKQVESIAYSFVGGDAAHRASIIYWDPSAGVDYVSSARPMSLVMVGAGIAFAIFALF